MKEIVIKVKIQLFLLILIIKIMLVLLIKIKNIIDYFLELKNQIQKFKGEIKIMFQAIIIKAHLIKLTLKLVSIQIGII